MKEDRKGQMEIIGLVVIVILITLGMLFMAVFALRESPQKRIITQKGLAVSTISALMKTTISDPDCLPGHAGGGFFPLGGVILEDCALNEQFTGGSHYRCGGKHSCDFFRQQAAELLEQTLGQWNKNYQFSSVLVSPGRREVVPLFEPITRGGGCPPLKDRESSGSFPLSTDVGMVESVLYLCG